MDLETVRRLSRELAAVGTDMVELSGKGDPIAHPGLTEIVVAIKDAGLSCSLVTNATLAKPDLAPTLVNRGLDRLSVSLNAGSREVFLRSNKKDLWDKAVRFLEEVLEKRRSAGKKSPWVRITHVVTKENVDDMDNMVKVCVDLGADEVSFLVMGELTETVNLQLDKDEIQTVRSNLARWGETLEKAGVVHALPVFARELEVRTHHGHRQDNPLQKELPCYVGWMFCVIGPDGVVVPCCYCDDTVLGNVYEDSFGDIWRGARYRKFRRDCLDIPRSKRWICEECFTCCNRIIENRSIYNKLHPLKPR